MTTLAIGNEASIKVAKLYHCGQYHKAKRYYFVSRTPQLQWEVLLMASCQKHTDIPVMAWYGVDWQGQQTVTHRITYRQQKTWLQRIQSECLSKGSPPSSVNRVPHSIVSDYTRFISQPVDRVYERLLHLRQQHE